jgi:hypothetical protein
MQWTCSLFAVLMWTCVAAIRELCQWFAAELNCCYLIQVQYKYACSHFVHQCRSEIIFSDVMIGVHVVDLAQTTSLNKNKTRGSTCKCQDRTRGPKQTKYMVQICLATWSNKKDACVAQVATHGPLKYWHADIQHRDTWSSKRKTRGVLWSRHVSL